MLFNSGLFVFLFLPTTLFIFFKLGARYQRLAIAWLVMASAVFYAFFSIHYLLLLLGLTIFNYLFGKRLARQAQRQQPNVFLLTGGIIINLGVLFYYKYSQFFLTNLNAVFHTQFVLKNIIIPIGISFFTFQKIGYLIDAYQGKTKDYSFLDFLLFVMYFPQLIAGPIVHHAEIIPQFKRPSMFKLNYSDMTAGIILFTIGFLKKTLVADQLASLLEPAFSAIDHGIGLSFFEGWMAATSFTFQIYFDFSGYTDMALGLALMMGIRLPLNFNSPYKARSMIDFWRRWHMTLSRFLRDYVYIPLGGNRCGVERRYINLFLTMIIGGVWHGANWTFLIWGALHGSYLVINHAWIFLSQKLSIKDSNPLYTIPCQSLTFLSVVIAWVFFRAQTFKGAILMLEGMFGFNGFVFPANWESKTNIFIRLLKNVGAHFNNSGVSYMGGLYHFLFLLGVLFIVWFFPNSQQICAWFRPALGTIEPTKLSSMIARTAFGKENILSLPIVIFFGVAASFLLAGIIFYKIMSQTSLPTFIYFHF